MYMEILLLLLFGVLGKATQSWRPQTCEQLISHRASKHNGVMVIKSGHGDKSYVIERMNTAWVMKDLIEPSKGFIFDGNMDFHANYIIASAVSDDMNAVYLYGYDEGHWITQEIWSMRKSKEYGQVESVSICDGRAVILTKSIVQSSATIFSEQFYMSIFQRDNHAWSLQSMLAVSSGVNGEGQIHSSPLLIPSSIAIQNNIIFVTGEITKNSKGRRVANVYTDVEERGEWPLTTELYVSVDTEDTEANEIGCQVEVRSTVAVVLSCIRSDDEVVTDKAFVFTYSKGQWSYEAILYVKDSTAALSSISAVVDISDDDTSISIGSVDMQYVFQKHDSSWSQTSIVRSTILQSGLSVCDDNVIVERGVADVLPLGEYGNITDTEHYGGNDFDSSFVYGMVILSMFGIVLVVALCASWPTIQNLKGNRAVRRVVLESHSV